jgi:aconitase B
VTPSKTTLIDAAERAGATFAQAFLAAVTLGHTVAPAVTDLRALELAAIAGAYAVGKYLLVQANAFLAKQPVTPAK